MGIFISKFFTYGNCGTLQEIVDAVNISMASIQICTKTFIAWTQRHTFRRILESTVNDWQSCILIPESREIMIKYAYIGRILFTCQGKKKNYFIYLCYVAPKIDGSQRDEELTKRPSDPLHFSRSDSLNSV